MKARGKIQSWEISDKFWEKVKNLIPKKERIPKKEYKRAAGAGFFQKIWELGLEEYDEMYGIGWEWQSIDGSMVKAPLARESVGANPTDRKKMGRKDMFS
jgi:hypothetical protein